ncbi:hypothetical protein GIW70_21670 [Pseudomonas syringae]|nr:hypothetical protein [Pseudomonas syringae]MCF5070794.1 hypothetical protein [Pseudomonas syringae]
MKKSTALLGLLTLMSMTSAQAASREIRALFQPDPAQPHKNVFINKTPNSGYCADLPAECTENGMFSIQLPLRFDSSGEIAPGDSIAMKVPANWRQLTVTNSETQEAETVEVRIIGFGSKYVLSHNAADLVGVTDPLEGHRKLWTSNSWVYAPAPCRYSGVGVFGDNFYRFFWKSPVEAQCAKEAAFKIPRMAFDTLDFAYELRTPNPLAMSSGLYTGSLLYTIGPGMDFDMGSQMQPNDSQLMLDFVLDVQHTLKITLPPGGDKVALEPEGGWQQWINGGRKPARIYRDQMFYVSASSRFKVMMQCQNSNGGERCKMYGAGGNSTDVRTYLTLPAGLTNESGGPVNRYPLRHNTWSMPFQPTQYLDRKAGVLHFDIPGDAINNLLKPGVSGVMSTNITIIWDSEV